MTPQEQGAAIVGGSDLTFGSWTEDPSAVLGAIVGRAADAVLPVGRGEWSLPVVFERRGSARQLTHLACWLVAQPSAPQPRGSVLDTLVERFGDGL